MAFLALTLLLSLAGALAHPSQYGQTNNTGKSLARSTSYCIPDVTLPKSCKGRTADDSPDPHVSSNVESEVTFILYTPKYEPDAKDFVIGDQDSFKNSGFNISSETKIIIHGYFSSAKNFEHTVFAYLTAADYNVVLMDWSGLAKWCYCEHVIKNIEKIGKVLGKLLNFLGEQGVDMKRIHLIGHSLGSHIAGIGSVNSINGRVGRITALDPARPGFSEGKSTDRLDKSRADFVDVIHTSAHSFGIAEVLGHVDFYPNGGQSPQPGCSGVTADVCSHSRAHYLFTESITTDVGFRGVLCQNWASFVDGICNTETSPTEIMGERINKNSQQGIYYLKTGASCPYFVVARSAAESKTISTTVGLFTIILLLL